MKRKERNEKEKRKKRKKEARVTGRWGEGEEEGQTGPGGLEGKYFFEYDRTVARHFTLAPEFLIEPTD